MNEHQDEENKPGAKTMAAVETATAALMDDEAQQVGVHRNKISRITLALEEMLLKEDCTMGDLAEIMDLFNARAHRVFSLTKIKDVKQAYGNS